VQTEGGQQYGPVTGDQLQAWYEEGRITADCQLLRKGAGQWQWATDVYPDLELAVPTRSDPKPQAKPAQPRLTELRAAPTQSANVITPLSPDDFPSAGTGLKPLGPVLRPLPPGYEEPRYRSMEAAEDRRKFAPYMVARDNRPPLHKMLIAVAIGNFVVGTLRAGGYFVSIINLLLAIGTEEGKLDETMRNSLSIALAIAFLMLGINVAIIAGGIGLLQQREWGRTATAVGALISLVVQLVALCVVTLLAAEGSRIAQGTVVWMVVFMGPSVLYDAVAASILAIPRVVEDLEE
jgi:hypothetical protein